MASVEDAQQIWQAGVNGVDPQFAVAKHIAADRQTLTVCGEKLSSPGTVHVLAVGKAAQAMAQGFLVKTETLQRPITGWVLMPGNHDTTLGPLRCVGVRPVGSNFPTQTAVDTTDQLLEELQQAQANDVLIVLLSGGSSAMLCAPAPGLSLERKLKLTKDLAAAGADITELNQVRRALSTVKGGGILSAFSGKVVKTLSISDVCGDDPAMIGSGPTVVRTDAEDPAGVLKKFGLADDRLLELLQTPVTVSPSLTYSYEVVANNAIAKDMAGKHAESLGYEVVMNHDLLTGEVSAAAKEIADRVSVLAQSGRPVCFISGGETTVNLPPNPGKGGRNMHLALAVLKSFEKWPTNCVLLSAGTDGEDGPTDAAGAIIDKGVAQQTRETDLSKALASSASYDLCKQSAALFSPGLTGTNVMDLQVILASPQN